MKKSTFALRATAMSLIALFLHTPHADAQTASVTPLINTKGAEIGTLTLTPFEKGSMIQVDATLPAGTHGFHIHAIGKCDTPDFASAGGHYNPDNKEHGFNQKEGPHAGDLPNLMATEDGKISESVFIDKIPFSTLSTLSFVVHEGADDYQSQPSGASGNRIACATFNQK